MIPEVWQILYMVKLCVSRREPDCPRALGVTSSGTANMQDGRQPPWPLKNSLASKPSSSGRHCEGGVKMGAVWQGVSEVREKPDSRN